MGTSWAAVSAADDRAVRRVERSMVVVYGVAATGRGDGVHIGLAGMYCAMPSGR